MPSNLLWGYTKMALITSDFCEVVTLCAPNIIIQDCLPVGGPQICDYTIYETVAPEAGPFGDPWYNFWTNYNNQITLTPDDPATWWVDETVTGSVTFALEKWLGGPNYNPEYWVGVATGGIYDDSLSGYGLLEFFNRGPGGNIASLDPSTYLGDLIHFNLDGGAGDDYVQGANNADMLYGGDGDDNIDGMGGDDGLFGGDGYDVVYGGSGNDLADGGAGADNVYGGDGDDGLIGGLGNDRLWGHAGNDNLRGGPGDDQMFGGDGDDWMAGGADNDYMEGNAGNDCMAGGAGDDIMYGDSNFINGDMRAIEVGGDDLMLGGNGDDLMFGGAGNDKMNGDAGDDWVYGDDGNDLVAGGNGDDNVFGGNGDDIVRGGEGQDTLYGGAGCDVFVFCGVAIDCGDIIADFETGRDADQIDLSNIVDLDSIRVVQTGDINVVRLDLLVNGVAVQRIVVESDYLDLSEVFRYDTAYGNDAASLVRLADGVMVNLPSVSVISSDDGLFF